MRLDKLKFAALVRYICELRPQQEIDLCQLDILTDIPEPQQEPYRADATAVDCLLQNLNHENGLIDAIKAYRLLTGAGLKEAKDTVEKYRNIRQSGQL